MSSSTLGAVVPIPAKLPTILILLSFVLVPSIIEKAQEFLMYILLSDGDIDYIIPEVGTTFGSR